MPKTTPVTFDLRQEIHKVHHLDPSRSARQIAREFGLHHKTVSRILKRQEELAEPVNIDPIRHEAVRSLLRKGPKSTEELASALKTTPAQVV